MKRLAEQTLYEILEVPPDASTEAIAAAVERARMLYGPGSLATYTLMTPDESALLARRIEEARETLLDPELRPLYDEEIGRERAAPQNGASAHVAPVKPLPPWPPPPVIPAVRAAPPPPEAEDEDEDLEVDDEVDEVDDAGEVASGAARAREADVAAPPPAGAPAPVQAAAPQRSSVEEAPLAAPAAAPEAPPAPVRPAPILLDREVPPAPPPAAGPVATPVPMLPPPPLPPVVPDQTLWTGEVLRQIREARGISLSQLSERTKVTRHHIENIEADRYGLLPAPVYLRGILMSLARELRLDGQKVARSYLERFTGGAAPPPGPARGR